MVLYAKNVHKILVHGCDITNEFNIPIGLLSEDTLQTRHKEFQKLRLQNMRKNSREACNPAKECCVYLFLVLNFFMDSSVGLGNRSGIRQVPHCFQRFIPVD